MYENLNFVCRVTENSHFRNVARRWDELRWGFLSVQVVRFRMGIFVKWANANDLRTNDKPNLCFNCSLKSTLACTGYLLFFFHFVLFWNIVQCIVMVFGNDDAFWIYANIWCAFVCIRINCERSFVLFCWPRNFYFGQSKNSTNKCKYLHK